MGRPHERAGHRKRGDQAPKKASRKLATEDVATAAASLDVPEEVELKDPKDFKIIGTSRQKTLTPKRSSPVRPLFGLDVQREDMRIAMIAHPPAFPAKS